MAILSHTARHADVTPRGLYAITPDEHDTPRLLRRTEAVLRGGARWLQYRNKAADDALALAQASALLELARTHGVPLIVNDRIDLARRIGADGVHLGEDDADIAAARAMLGDTALIGASCYDDLGRAARAAAAGASYLAFGAFHPSATKANTRRPAPALLGEASRFGRPRVAIGGINADNAPALIAAGADLVAVISAVFDADDPERAARDIARLFDIPAELR